LVFYGRSDNFFILTHNFILFRRQVAEKILRCEYNFSGRRWNGISELAKEFVRGLLLPDLEDRPSAEDAMRSLWLARRYNSSLRYPTQEEISRVHRCMERFVGYSKLKKLVSIVLQRFLRDKPPN
jgi:serine/threonine protein kinase